MESPLAAQLLRGDFPAGSHVIVNASEADGIIFRSAGIQADVKVDQTVER